MAATPSESRGSAALRLVRWELVGRVIPGAVLLAAAERLTGGGRIVVDAFAEASPWAQAGALLAGLAGSYAAGALALAVWQVLAEGLFTARARRRTAEALLETLAQEAPPPGVDALLYVQAQLAESAPTRASQIEDDGAVAGLLGALAMASTVGAIGAIGTEQWALLGGASLVALLTGILAVHVELRCLAGWQALLTAARIGKPTGAAPTPERMGFEAETGAAALDTRPGGLLSRRQFYDQLRVEISRARRYGTELACAIMSLDDHERLRQCYGAEFAARMQGRAGTLVAANLRPTDVGAEHDVGEFAVLLPHIGARRGAVFAERVRARIEEEPFRLDGDPLHTHLSCGVAELAEGMSGEQLVARAVGALRGAKRVGGNIVRLAEVEPARPPSTPAREPPGGAVEGAVAQAPAPEVAAPPRVEPPPQPPPTPPPLAAGPGLASQAVARPAPAPGAQPEASLLVCLEKAPEAPGDPLALAVYNFGTGPALRPELVLAVGDRQISCLDWTHCRGGVETRYVEAAQHTGAPRQVVPWDGSGEYWRAQLHVDRASLKARPAEVRISWQNGWSDVRVSQSWLLRYRPEFGFYVEWPSAPHEGGS